MTPSQALLLFLLAGVTQASEAPMEKSTGAPAISATTVATRTAPVTIPLQPPDLREALASLTNERDALLTDVERLRSQRNLWVMLVIVLASGFAWLAYRRLVIATDRTAADSAESDSGESDGGQGLDPSTAITTRKRRNATITIRNSQTQRAEVTEVVETRRYFTGDASGTRSAPKKESSTSIRPPTVAAPAPSPRPPDDDELQPSTSALTKRTATEPVSASTNNTTRKNPKTVRVDHHSDRHEVVEVSVKPGTTGIFHKRGFTILEVMISLAVLATMLASIIASIYTLHRSRMLAHEQAESQEIGRLLIERIMSEPWGNLHNPTPGDFWFASYAANESATPLTGQRLLDTGMTTTLPGLDDLKVYLEYYPWAEAENALRNSTAISTSTPLGSRDRTMSFRIVVDWRSLTGTRQRHVQWFVRSE